MTNAAACCARRPPLTLSYRLHRRPNAGRKKGCHIRFAFADEIVNGSASGFEAGPLFFPAPNAALNGMTQYYPTGGNT